MAGAIIENMSTKKLCIVGGILLVFQIVAFLVGGLIAPAPTTAVPYMSIKCVDVRKNHHKTRWLVPWGPNKCDKIRDIEEAIPREIEANDIVFSVHIPLPSMEMSPWFQFMLFILQLDIAFKLNNQIRENAEVSMDVSLGYRDDMFSEWTEMAHERVPRKLKCTFTSPKTLEHEGRYYECDVMPFMEIGSVAHKYYLLNIRLPVNEKKKINVGIGEIKDIRLVGIHQNGGFTKVWFAMKTFLTPSIFIIMVWYWRRITMMSRPPVLLEKQYFKLFINLQSVPPHTAVFSVLPHDIVYFFLTSTTFFCLFLIILYMHMLYYEKAHESLPQSKEVGFLSLSSLTHEQHFFLWFFSMSFFFLIIHCIFYLNCWLVEIIYFINIYFFFFFLYFRIRMISMAYQGEHTVLCSFPSPSR
ncbi:wntless-like, partial [Sigmodon hispidus]